jgi:hypothetical protein
MDINLLILPGVALSSTIALFYVLNRFELDVDVQFVNDRFTRTTKPLPSYRELKLLLEYAAGRDLLGCYATGTDFVLGDYLFANCVSRQRFHVFCNNTPVYDEGGFTTVDNRIKETLCSYIDYLGRIHSYGD